MTRPEESTLALPGWSARRRLWATLLLALPVTLALGFAPSWVVAVFAGAGVSWVFQVLLVEPRRAAEHAWEVRWWQDHAAAQDALIADWERSAWGFALGVRDALAPKGRVRS